MERTNSMSRGKRNFEGAFVAIIEVVNDGRMGGEFLLAFNNEEENARCDVCGLIVMGDDAVVVNDEREERVECLV
ncbi:hypothetical protein CsSME_00029226 [Camellia sinensis var. sinensis]